MSEPRLGMSYENVRRRVKRISSTPTGDARAKFNLVSSLLNQAKLCDGDRAADELKAELIHSSRSFSGAGNKQIGWGEGRRFGTGKWIYDGKSWKKKD